MEQLELLLKTDKWFKRPVVWATLMCFVFGIGSAAALRLAGIDNVGDWSILIATLAFMGFATLHAKLWYDSVFLQIRRVLKVTYSPNEPVQDTQSIPDEDYTQPKKEPEALWIVHDREGYPEGVFEQFGISQNDLIEVSRAVVESNPDPDLWKFSHALLAGKEAGKPLTRDQYEASRTILERNGIVCMRVRGNHRSGYKVTRAGRSFFKFYYSLRKGSPAPTPLPNLNTGGTLPSFLERGRIHMQAKEGGEEGKGTGEVVYEEIDIEEEEGYEEGR